MAAGKEYSFVVDVDDDKGQPFGPVSKENLDVARFLIDFSCWLDSGETLAEIGPVRIAPQQPQNMPPWQADYPLDETSATTPPPDIYPLQLTDAAILGDNKSIQVQAHAGTPGLAYVISLVVYAGASQRRRQVDILLDIDVPLNPLMVSPGDVPPAPSPVNPAPLIITGTTALPLGFTGRIYVNNTSGAPITVTLPTNPVQGDLVMPVDMGNAGTYAITYAAAASQTIEGNPTFVSNINRDDLGFEWNGSYWFVRSNKYGLLA